MVRALLVALVVSASGLGAVACDKGGGEAPDAASPLGSFGRFGAPPPLPSHSASASDDASAVRAPPISHHVSLAAILLKSAYDLPLNGEQRGALDAAEAQLYPAGAASPWTAVRTFQADLVAGIRAGKIDTAKLKADEADIDSAVAAGQAAEADALDTLHGVLDESARQSLADGVKARRARLEGPAARPPGSAPDGGVVDPTKRRFELLTAELGLDAGQQKRVAALLARQAAATGPAVEQARRDAMHRRVDALLAAFPQESFDAHKLDLSGPSGKAPHERLDEAAAFAQGLMPILNKGQILMFADQTEHGGGRPEHLLEDVQPGPPRPLDLRPHP